MSNPRKVILPGAGVWESFFDKGVQRVLADRHNVPALEDSSSEDARTESLAWPLLAFEAVDDLTQDRATKVRRQVNFLVAYAEDRAFVADLLVAVTAYHQVPEDMKSLRRRIAELSNISSSTPYVFHFKPSESRETVTTVESPSLLDWKSIAERLDCNNSVEQLMVEFGREKKHRASILRKWSDHFASYWKLSGIPAKSGRRPPPLRHISFD